MRFHRYLRAGWGLVGLLVLAACTAPPRPYLAEAEQAAAWLQSVAVSDVEGTIWPIAPPDSTVVTHLYSGTSGVVLFFLEAYRATGEADYLASARAGADYLLATLPDTLASHETGLYTGWAGIGFTLQETFKITEDERYAVGARHCVELLKTHLARTDTGAQWNDVTDIIGGNAGTGLFMLYAHREMNDPEAKAIAVEVGHTLLAQAQPAAQGHKWGMAPTFPRLMPNFSHGTAGIAYFLATLHMETQDPAFLDGAIEGALYLQSAATYTDTTAMIFHHEPEGEDLYYLSWCHGPPGTARLFYRLWQITGNMAWLDVVDRLAHAVLASGVPDQQTAGFWNNAGQCCGSAGIAQFFLHLYRQTGEEKHRAYAEHVVAHLLGKATRTDTGSHWIHAEHRVQPDNVAAQTGYMQGAAGIGLLLLDFDAFQQGRDRILAFPDDPF